MMLEQGADIEHVGNDVTGATPLLAATQEGHVEVVRMLLEQGADADKVRKDGGATPLHIASCEWRLYMNLNECKVEMVRILLQHGADINKTTDNGATPLYT